MRIEERIQPAIAFMPELASLNMGSMNFGLFPMLERFNEFRHSWERDYLEGSRDLVFRNTFKDVEYALRTCAGNGTRFEFECYDVGHLYNLANFLDRGLVHRPLFVQSVLASWAELVHTRRCGANEAHCRPAIWPGLPLVRLGRRAQTASDLRPGRCNRVATYAWDWKTAYGSDQASWRLATPLKCIASVR